MRSTTPTGLPARVGWQERPGSLEQQYWLTPPLASMQTASPVLGSGPTLWQVCGPAQAPAVHWPPPHVSGLGWPTHGVCAVAPGWVASVDVAVVRGNVISSVPALASSAGGQSFETGNILSA